MQMVDSSSHIHTDIVNIDESTRVCIRLDFFFFFFRRSFFISVVNHDFEPTFSSKVHIEISLNTSKKKERRKQSSVSVPMIDKAFRRS